MLLRCATCVCQLGTGGNDELVWPPKQVCCKPLPPLAIKTDDIYGAHGIGRMHHHPVHQPQVVDATNSLPLTPRLNQRFPYIRKHSIKWEAARSRSPLLSILRLPLGGLAVAGGARRRGAGACLQLQAVSQVPPIGGQQPVLQQAAGSASPDPTAQTR